MNDYTFGNFLYELRMEKGLSQSQLGDMMGVSNKAVSKWEMGVSKPRPAMLVMLASFFGVTVEELFAGERSEKTEDNTEQKDDTSLKLWTGEYSKKKKHAKNALITAFFLPAAVFIALIIIIVTIPNDMIVGPIIILITLFAEVIDIALILVFYGSARRLKRILYATYPERAEEITQTISPEKNEMILSESTAKNIEMVTTEQEKQLTAVSKPIRKKKERVPMLKWEKICYSIGISLGIVFNLSRLLNLIITDGEGTAITLIVCSIIFVPSLTLMLVATIHYAYRTRRKK